MSEFVTGADRERAHAHLTPGEELLWVGKPVPTGFQGLTGLLFIQCVAMALFFIIMLCLLAPGMVLNPVGMLLCALFLLPELALGIALPLVKRRQMRRWLYVLTPRRALMLRHDGMREWPLAPGMVREYRPGALGSIVLGYKKSIFHSNKPWLREEGFLRLRCREAGEAMALLERLLHGQARPQMASPEALAHMQQRVNDATAEKLAAAPGLMAAQLLLTTGIALGSIFSALWWWAALAAPVGIFLLLFGGICLLFSAALLHTYRRGRLLLRERHTTAGSARPPH